MHARAALTEGGFSAGDLKEIVLQQAIYCGVPAANKAFEVLREITERIVHHRVSGVNGVRSKRRKANFFVSAISVNLW